MLRKSLSFRSLRFLAVFPVLVFGGLLWLGGQVTAAGATPAPKPGTAPFSCGGAWTTQAPYPAAVSVHAMAALNGMLYSFGGVINSAETNAAYRCDAGLDQWTTLAVLPQARAGASAVSDGTAIYILGGSRSGNLQNTFWRYDPASNTYTTLAVMPLSATRQAAAYLNGKIYRIGGCTAAGCAGINQVDVYTIATDTWASGPAYPAALYKGSAVALGGYIYVAGGVANGTTSPLPYPPRSH